MKIYTKQGDKGQTSVYAKKVLKVAKDDAIIECYGTLDELNSYIGLVASLAKNDEHLSSWLSAFHEIQQTLFKIGFAMSADSTLSIGDIEALEAHIDSIQSSLPAQTHFILPGGCEISSHMHVARTVARRAERTLVSASHMHDIEPLALSYINRLSDFLFVIARHCNYAKHVDDIKV